MRKYEEMTEHSEASGSVSVVLGHVTGLWLCCVSYPLAATCHRPHPPLLYYVPLAAAALKLGRVVPSLLPLCPPVAVAGRGWQ